MQHHKVFTWNFNRKGKNIAYDEAYDDEEEYGDEYEEEDEYGEEEYMDEEEY